MKYAGSSSTSVYESECARTGFPTRRVPFHKGDEKFFVLITTPPGHPTGTSCESWVLFTEDESTMLLEGVISGGVMDPAKYMRDGLDINYLGKLAASGYYPDFPEEQYIPATETVEGAGGMKQFSFLPA